MKMLYYISEDIQKEGLSFANHLIKRADTYEEAVDFCKKAVEDWRCEGLNARVITVEDDGVWGAQALDEEFIVKHFYHIFATPMFMAGGQEGL